MATVGWTIIVMLVLAAAGYGAYKYYLNRQDKKAEKKAKEAEMLEALKKRLAENKAAAGATAADRTTETK